MLCSARAEHNTSSHMKSCATPSNNHRVSVKAPYKSGSFSFQTKVVLLLICGIVVFSPLVDGGTTHVAVMIIRLGILTLLGCYLGFGISDGKLCVPRMAPGSAVVAYLGLAVASTVWSPYTNQSMQWLLILLSYAVFLYLLVASLTTWQCIGVAVAVLCAVGCFEAVWVLVQTLWYGVKRASGTFFNPNFVAGYLAAIWVVIFSVAGYFFSGRKKWICATPARTLSLLGVGILLGTMLAAVLLTQSRGGGVVLLCGLASVMWARFGAKGIGIFLLILLAAVIIPNPWRDRFYSEYLVNPVGYARWQIWESSVRAIFEHPFGIGLGLYQYEAPRLMFPIESEIVRYGWVAQSAHSEYLQMGVELGLLGLLLFLWGIAAIAQEFRRGLKTRMSRWQRGALVGAGSAAVGILLHAAIDSNLREPAIAILLLLCVGIVLSARRLSSSHEAESRVLTIRSRAVAVVLSTVVIGMCVMEVVRLGWAWVVYEQGSQAVMRQDLSGGMEHYSHAIALDPGKAMYHKSLAAAHFQRFQKSGAAEAVQATVVELQAATALNPLDGRTHERMAAVYFFLAMAQPDTKRMALVQREQRAVLLESATSSYLQALEREPFSAFHRLELGRLSSVRGDREGAQRLVQEAVAIEPNFLPGRLWLARHYLDTQQLDAALNEYRQVVDRQSRYDSRQKGATEQQFLNVDRRELEAALERAGVRI